MARPWMPLFVADYLADTRRLTTLEHGTYLLLIMEYWQQGGLPDNDDDLAQIAGLSRSEWKRIRAKIASLFKEGWRHKRIDEELARASEISDRRRENAEKRWSKRDANADANGMHRAGVPQPQSQESSLRSDLAVPAEKPKRAKPRSQIAEDAQPDEVQRRDAADRTLDQATFRAEWQRFRDHHRAKGSVMADWQAAWRTWLGNIAKFQPARAGPAPLRRNPDLAAYKKIESESHERNRQNGNENSTARAALGIFGPPASLVSLEDRDEPGGKVIDLLGRCTYR